MPDGPLAERVRQALATYEDEFDKYGEDYAGKELLATLTHLVGYVWKE